MKNIIKSLKKSLWPQVWWHRPVFSTTWQIETGIVRGEDPAKQLLELSQNNMVKKEAKDGARWQKAAYHVEVLGPILV